MEIVLRKKFQLLSEALFADELLPYCHTEAGSAYAFDCCFRRDIIFSSHPFGTFIYCYPVLVRSLAAWDMEGTRGIVKTHSTPGPWLRFEYLLEIHQGIEWVIALQRHVHQITIRRISCLPLRDTNNIFFPLIFPIYTANNSIDDVSFDPFPNVLALLIQI